MEFPQHLCLVVPQCFPLGFLVVLPRQFETMNFPVLALVELREKITKLVGRDGSWLHLTPTQASLLESGLEGSRQTSWLRSC